MNYSIRAKTAFYSVPLLLATFGLSTVWAAPVTVTKTWVAGDTLNAADLNQNFGDVKTAVDDNNSRLTTVETTGGDVTGVTAGTGLTGGGASGDVAINVDSTAVQTRVSASCIAGQSIRAINEDGTVTCEVDTNTNTTTVGVNATINPTFTSIPKGNTAVTTVTSVSIRAPSAGYVLISHTGDVTTFGEPNTVDIGIGVTSTVMITSVSVGNLDTISTRRYKNAYSVQYLKQVTAAGTYTYYGLAQKNTVFNAGSANVSPQAITAVFIPHLYPPISILTAPASTSTTGVLISLP